MSPETDELGAHVSAAGGVEHAPGRAADLDAVVLQLFTKQPNRWAEPGLDDARIAAFHRARREHGTTTTAAHDSYLINLASPDETLRARSLRSFQAELQRGQALGLDYLVSHPGNATDGRREHGLRRNAEAIIQALDAVPASPTVLLETTAGSGTALGATFPELARLLDQVAQHHPGRIGACVDTCHIFAAGYDLRDDYDGVIDTLDEQLGLRNVRLFHLNDSAGPLGSHRDRHAGIGEGELGPEPFRRIMTDRRLAHIPKILETPKGDQPLIADRRNLERLRGFRRA